LDYLQKVPVPARGTHVLDDEARITVVVEAL